jgi:hypothetical protein
MTDVMTIVPVGNNNQIAAAQTLLDEGSTAMIFNTSETVTLWIGNNPALTSGYQNAVPIAPLGYLVVTAEGSPIYGVVATNVQINVAVIPGGIAFFTPQLNATITGPVTIAGTVNAEIVGTPTVDISSGNVDATITGPVDISSGTVTFTNSVINTVGAGGYTTGGQIGNLVTSATANISPSNTVIVASGVNVETYTSVTLTAESISNSSVAAGAAVCAIIRVNWLNVNNVAIATDFVSVLCSGGSECTWEIPVKGAAFSVSVSNIGTTGTISLAAGSVYIDGSYRVIPNIRVVGTSILTQPTLTGCVVVAQGFPTTDISQWIASIAYSWSGTNTNVVFILPQWSGEVTGFYQVITTALAKNATIVDLSYAVQGQVLSGSGYAFGLVQNIPSAIDTNPVQTSFNLPPTQCALILATPAAAGEFFLSLVGVGN